MRLDPFSDPFSCHVFVLDTQASLLLDSFTRKVLFIVCRGGDYGNETTCFFNEIVLMRLDLHHLLSTARIVHGLRDPLNKCSK